MANPDKVKVGDRLWDCRKQRMGNTTIHQMCAWNVVILEVPEDRLLFKVSWNHNSPKRIGRWAISKLKATPPRRRFGILDINSLPQKCATCGSTEELTICCGCGRVLCKAHKKEDPCHK